MRIRMHRYAISRKIQFLTGKGNELTKLIQLPVLIKLHVILQLHKNISTYIEPVNFCFQHEITLSHQVNIFIVMFDTLCQ